MNTRALSKTDALVKALLVGASSVSVLVVALVLFFLLKEAVPFLSDSGRSTLFSTRWTPVSFQQEVYGILPLLSGSLLVTAIASTIAVPAGIGGAIYIAELAHPIEREILKPVIEVLAGIPSVVLGFFGLVVVAPLVKQVLGLPSGLTALTGALVLALMALPTVISISEDAIRAVPGTYKEASLALGAGELETIFKVVVPAALPGISAAVLLGIGRVIGETMAVMMVTGNAALLTLSPTESIRTITATIAAEMGEVPFGGTHYHALFLLGAILMLSTFSFNMAAMYAIRKAESK
ncbi:MAG: phosphate ABC transporter permease subunit PstC [Nitrospiraceae bacterium]|nr:phosphate ABC transporter permease subunit PstC [Nitrospiraceae bacterium]